MDYVKIQDTCRRLIAKNGRQVTFVKYLKTGQTNKPWRAEDVTRQVFEEEVTVDVVSAPLGFVAALGFQFAQDDLVHRASNILIAAPPEGVELDTFNGVIDETLNYKIKQLEKLRPADTTVIYGVRVVR